MQIILILNEVGRQPPKAYWPLDHEGAVDQVPRGTCDEIVAVHASRASGFALTWRDLGLGKAK